jgi:predicted dehydrogenase
MRLAFIGGSGHLYLRAAIDDPACDIDRPVAVAGDGHDDAAARALHTKMPGAVWYDDYRQLLDRHKPDLVNVGGVYGYNGDIAADVLQRGINVCSDKPIAANWQQLDRLKQVLAGSSARLITEFNMRSSRAYRAAKVAVEHGLIGDVILATAQKSYRFGARPAWFGRRESFGGLMLWVASHAIDYIAYCTGRTYARVTATGGNLSQPAYPEMEDHVAALFELDNGGTAVVRADYLRPSGAPTHGDDRLRIAGTKGIIEIMHECCHLVTDQKPRDLTKDAHVDPLHHELLAALRGARTDIYSTEQSLHMANILLHARDAQDQRKWIDIA